jgi:hypothetical protein
MQTDAAKIQTPTHEVCANCGLALTGTFCAGCGQSAEAIKRPAWEFIHHALETFFDFDARGLRTLALLFVPGEVAAQYLAGRRPPGALRAADPVLRLRVAGLFPGDLGDRYGDGAVLCSEGSDR